VEGRLFTTRAECEGFHKLRSNTADELRMQGIEVGITDCIPIKVPVDMGLGEDAIYQRRLPL